MALAICSVRDIKQGLESYYAVSRRVAAYSSSPSRCPTRQKISKLQTVQIEPHRTMSYLSLRPAPAHFRCGAKDRRRPFHQDRYRYQFDGVHVACCGFGAHRRFVRRTTQKPQGTEKDGRDLGVLVVIIVVQCKQLSLSQTPLSVSDAPRTRSQDTGSHSDDWRRNAAESFQRLANE